MIPRIRAHVAAILFACALPLGAARADVPASARDEARDRFDRALRLSSENDNAAALAEFKRVYELVPNPIVLFNIGLVYAAMNKPVEAVDALDKLLAAPGSLSPDRLAKARELHEEQANRVAFLRIDVNVPGAAIEVDGIEVAKSPLSAPLAISSGAHVIGAVAEGHSPARKAVALAGKTAGTVSIELAPMVGRLAHLALKSHLPGANAMVDGVAAGKTPLAAQITLAPGTHRVELERAGYATARQDVTLGDGASAEIALEPEEDRVAIEAEGGTLALTISQSEALVTVDGRARGVYLGSLRLAKGPHRVRVERGGFLPYERDVDVRRGTVTTVAIDLYPGPDTLAAHKANARFHRTWGITGIAAGTAVLAGGIVVLGVDAGDRSSAKTQYVAFEQDLAHLRSPCASTDPRSRCNAKINGAHDNYTAAQSRDGVGIGLGVAGVGVAAVGVALLLTGGDSKRYDERPSGDPFANIRVLPAMSGPRSGGLGFQGTF